MPTLMVHLLQGAKFSSPSNGEAGFDLHAMRTHYILPDEQVSVPTGVIVAIPEYFAGLVRDVGLAQKHISLMEGVIDPSYRGEIVVLLRNLGRLPYEIKPGDKVAQIVVSPVITVSIQVKNVKDLGE